MRTHRTVAKFVAASFALIVLVSGAAGFLSHHSLTVDVLGSYFPAWMVCILSGLALTLIAHWIVQFRNLKAYLGPAPHLLVSHDRLHLRDVDFVLPKLICIKPPHL